MCAVEWKPLKDVCNILNGFAFKSQEYVKDGVRIIRISDVQSGYISDKDLVFYSLDKLDEFKRYLLNTGDLVMSLTGNPGRVALVTNANMPCALNQRVACLRAKNICNSYLFYLLNSKEFEATAFANSTGGAQKNLSTTWLGDFKIPIPSLAKQQEIVSHLDTFTTLISNLESELDMRRKQYEHYRNQLLDFDRVEGVEWKTLGEIGEFVRGNGIQKKDFVEDGYGCIHYGQVYTQFGLLAYETIANIEKALYDKCRIAKCGDIVLATTSENLEDVAKPVIWLGDEDIAVSGDAFIYKHNQNPIFIGSQFLTDRFSKFKGMNAKGAKVIRITGDSMAEYKIALPSLEKQNEIAEGIKSFENLIQSLEQEIKLRKQQYEYYREKLLTFE